MFREIEDKNAALCLRIRAGPARISPPSLTRFGDGSDAMAVVSVMGKLSGLENFASGLACNV